MSKWKSAFQNLHPSGSRSEGLNRRVGRHAFNDHDITLDIQRKIEDGMYLDNDESKKFICRTKLDSIWSEVNLQTIPEFANFHESERLKAKQDFILVLSILICMGWHELQRFRPVFMRAGLDDNHLFFDDGQLRQRLGRATSTFLTFQYHFKPEIIRRRPVAFKQFVDTRVRLPFMKEPVKLGSGGYGTVSLRVIAPRCFRDEVTGTGENSEPLLVACKQFTSPDPSEDFQREVENLEFIKEPLNDQRNVLKHLAAIVHGQTLLIIFPYVNLYNLEVFLREGWEPANSTADPQRRYTFDEEFRLLGDSSKRHRAIINQAYDLAGALLWLHEELRIFSKPNRYLAHMDLKPENILIDGNPLDQGSAAGVWKLSDFGISAFDKDTNRSVDDAATIGDFTQRLTSRGTPVQKRRGHGAYQPPEVALEREIEDRESLSFPSRKPIDGRKCDVWSFSGILSDVLAFALEGAKGYEDLRGVKRANSRDDNFFTFLPSAEGDSTSITDANCRVKINIVEWWSNIAAASNTSWVPNYVSILQQTMRPRPEQRKDSRFIVGKLGELHARVEADTRRSLSFSNPYITTGIQDHVMAMPDSLTNGSVPSSNHAGNLQSLWQAQTTLPASSYVIHNHKPSVTETLDIDKLTIESSREANQRTTSSSSATENMFFQSDSLLVPKDSLTTSMTALPVSPRYDFRESSDEPPVLNTATCSAVALDPTGKRVAALNGSEVRIVSTMRQDSDDDIYDEIRSLSSGVIWSKLQLAYPFLASYGSQGSATKCGELHDICTAPPVEPTAIKGVLNKYPLSDIMMSPTGVLACIYSKFVQLYLPDAGVYKPLSIPPNVTAIKACGFCGSGDAFFLYMKSPSTDYVQRFSLASTQLPTLASSMLSFKTENTGRYERRLWPSFSSDFCIVYERRGAFIAHPPSSLKKTMKRKDMGEKLGVGLMVNNQLLLCAKNGSLVAYSVAPDQNHGDSSAINLQSIEGVKIMIPEESVMALHNVSGRHDLVVCSPKMGLKRFTISP